MAELMVAPVCTYVTNSPFRAEGSLFITKKSYNIVVYFSYELVYELWCNVLDSSASARSTKQADRYLLTR